MLDRASTKVLSSYVTSVLYDTYSVGDERHVGQGIHGGTVFICYVCVV